VGYDEDEEPAMSVIDDTRKVMQDFLAPELRAISVRLDALERRFEDSDRRAERRHDEVLAAIAKISDITELRERLARLEAKDRPHQ
jgi:hypothetical protein